MLTVTFFGTTTLLFDDGRDQILFDAHFTRPSLLSYLTGRKMRTDTSLCTELIWLHHMDRLRAIFISHTHHDHVMDAPFLAKQCGAVLYGSPSAKNVALGGGVREENIVQFHHGSQFDVGAFQIGVIRSLHSKPTLLNNDLGVPITKPLIQPVSLKQYHEGGSYDLFVTHNHRRILIRPSFNYIPGQLDGIQADVVFLGVAGLAGADQETERAFFAETVEKTGAKLVIPIHWDNFFSPLGRPVTGMPGTERAFFRLADGCRRRGIHCLIQYPCTSVEL